MKRTVKKKTSILSEKAKVWRMGSMRILDKNPSVFCVTLKTLEEKAPPTYLERLETVKNLYCTFQGKSLVGFIPTLENLTFVY